ncbi:response regulator [Leptolyngbya sp. FACHB-36]|uniref:response regulator n=1 Tax=Leptolyngbya sp. FACHB-36 TaxID=2692808 RepID=UPI0016803570|nr:response regulator [Leptolyngbya sp. FACHB-36]MBD2020150.1 response regulator [Leptolyngbya sp. FACHB-36]
MNPAFMGLRILIVDDDHDSRDLLTYVLQSEGASVVAVESVQAALVVIKQQSLDILVSDITLPDADGYFLIQEVRRQETERGGHLPAIAVTAGARPEDRANALAAGFQKYLSKPVDLDELIAEITDLIPQSLEVQQSAGDGN